MEAIRPRKPLVAKRIGARRGGPMTILKTSRLEKAVMSERLRWNLPSRI
jgi:hypothetical protein